MSTIIENEEFWKQEVEKLKTSGLSRSQYCRNHAINYDRLGYWLKRLSPASSKFVPVKLQAPQSGTTHATLCTIEFRGHILKIHDLSALSLVIERLT
jgi:hypothetical protein